ncbi:DUF3710 domain-containing protein [Corynebacterium stationis]|uniref:DUF3710 domain-containing protein n=1 Tax=Corynebacterium stationis TaxID=1705 RepID=UPI00242EEB57|nr:DUF3710 domain-containing protein [Corynebacterium stationis]
MALWPFGKNKKKNNAEQPAQQEETFASGANSPERTDAAENPTASEQPLSADAPAPADTPGDAAAAQGLHVTVNRHDAINGDMGPFDGDSVDIETFDFSEFSTGILDLKSMKIPLPKRSQVQVEMGAQGPKMLHIITEFGRITPVAFAAPRSTGQWESSVNELVENIQRDGMPTQLEEGPWGTEIAAQNANGMIRIIGIEGPRWLLRLTLAAPTGKEEDLTELAREVASRVFVYRGDDPILAGNSLPVTMPPQLVKQVQDEMERRKQEQNKPQEQSQQDTSAANKAAQEAAARQLFQMLGGNAAAQAAKNSEHHPENDPEDSDTSAESDDTSGDDSEGNGDSK